MYHCWAKASNIDIPFYHKEKYWDENNISEILQNIGFLYQIVNSENEFVYQVEIKCKKLLYYTPTYHWLDVWYFLL